MGQELGIPKGVEFGTRKGETRMSLSRSPSPTGSWELGLGDRKKGGRAQLKAARVGVKVVLPGSGRWGSHSHVSEVLAAAAPPGSAWGPPATGPGEAQCMGAERLSTPATSAMSAPHLHHSVTDSPIRFLLAQKQQG